MMTFHLRDWNAPLVVTENMIPVAEKMKGIGAVLTQVIRTMGTVVMSLEVNQG